MKTIARDPEASPWFYVPVWIIASGTIFAVLMGWL